MHAQPRRRTQEPEAESYFINVALRTIIGYWRAAVQRAGRLKVREWKKREKISALEKKKGSE